jgi:cytochrome c oxidase accessory protein FixG
MTAGPSKLGAGVDRQARVIPIYAQTGGAADADVAGSSLFEAHRKIYPRAVTGVFAFWRIALVLLTQLVYYGLPWLNWNGHQSVLFDLAERKFYLLGLVLWPQDLIFLTGLLVLSALVLFLFTAVAGRLWCGYACPQTVYTEVFMWIERRIEGDRVARQKFDAAPWGLRKLGLKSAKQFVWIALALWTGFTFVGYFTPIRVLASEVIRATLGPSELFWILFYGFATYGNAGYMREQVCKYMCPYARFQGAMFDNDTLIVSYDARRGETRGSRPRKADHHALGLGDCVDCGLCVQVCPTGIDIRKGLQYECISCAACIDVCDSVMVKMNYPKGLIRHSTQRALAVGEQTTNLVRHLLRPRVLVYGGLLASLTIALGTALYQRAPVRVDVIRDRNAFARIVENGVIENVYRFQLMNATEVDANYQISVSGPPGIAIAAGDAAAVKAANSQVMAVRVRMAPDNLPAGSKPIRFTISDRDHSFEVHEKSTFIVPR